MIQDKIFFDEKDPTGLSYNTPFTFYGSYQGRLWSKSPSGSIQYYTQNSDLSVYAITGSNQFSGSQTVTGSLTVTGTITGTVAGTTSTASYVEYTNVANKPAIVSGSAQISFNGITDKPTLVSGSSQVTYSGLTGIPSGIVSGSAQISNFGIFATTGSNGFNGSQSITGSLTVTGQVVAQTLNVQQVTSSIVYSSGSNVFGNSVSNTQQFTGSVGVTGSLTVTTSGTELQVTNTGVNLGNALIDSHIISGSLRVNPNGLFVSGSGNVGIGTISPATKLTVYAGSGGISGTNDAIRLQVDSYSDAARNTIVWHQDGGNLSLGRFGLEWNLGTAQMNFVWRDVYNNAVGTTELMRLTGGGNLGIGVTPSAWDSTIFRGLQIGTSNPAFFIGRTDAVAQMQIGVNAYYDGTWKHFATNAASRYYQSGGEHVWENAVSASANASVTWVERMKITAGGNVGIGTTSPDVTGFGWRTLTIKGGTTSGEAGVLELQSPATTGAANLGIIAFLDGSNRNAQIGGVRDGANNSGALSFVTWDAGTGAERFRIASTGAATFSSSVTANSTINGYFGGITTGQTPATSGTTPVNPMLNLTNNRGIGMYFGGSYAGNYAQWIQVSDTGNLGVNYPLLLNPNGGNVGIGTPSPSINLQIAGTNNNAVGVSTFWSFNFVGQEITNLSNTANTVAGLTLIGGSGRASVSAIGNVLESTTLGALAFFTGGSGVGGGTVPERMRITSDGNVLIGTTSNPGQKMHVYSSGTTRIRVDGAGNNSGVLLAESGANKWSIATVSNDLVFYNEVASSTQMRIASSGAITTPFNLGKAYSQTSGAGTGTSIVDTGITYDTGDFGGYSRGATYQVVFNGNPNQGGSSAYFAQYTGIIMIYTGWNGSAVTTYIEYTQLAAGNNIGGLTLTPRFWNGSSEVSSIGVYTGGYQIRLKISGYNSGYTGADQTVYLKKIS